MDPTMTGWIVGIVVFVALLREMRSIGLADAKKVVDVLDDGGTIPINTTTTGVASTAGARAASTDTLADRARLLRDEAGPIHAIKYVREQTGMGLAEAKTFLDALR